MYGAAGLERVHSGGDLRCIHRIKKSATVIGREYPYPSAEQLPSGVMKASSFLLYRSSPYQLHCGFDVHGYIVCRDLNLFVFSQVKSSVV